MNAPNRIRWSMPPVPEMGQPCAPGSTCWRCSADGTEIDWNGLPLCSVDAHYDPISGTEYATGTCEGCDSDSSQLLDTKVGSESMGYDTLRLCLICRDPNPWRTR